MPPFLVNVQFKGDVIAPEGSGEDQTIFDGYSGVFRRVPEKTGRCLWRHQLIDSRFSQQRRGWIIPQQIGA